ncbi:MAG: glycosyltransferase family 2 protein [Phycisphaerae bacterium]|nr:glycosyltransferase family 2 protein [Phycisphaerae bacterium]
MPTVTFVIPCYNHGRFVRQAVESCLAQIDADVRVVVVNDGSTDGTTPAACDACAGPRVRVVHQPNSGLPAARNRGAALADSEFLAFLDADDWVRPRFVAALHQRLADEARDGRDADVSHVYCQEQLIEKGTGVWRVPDWDPVLLLLTNIHPVTALLRADRFHAVGGFDETMTGGYEDWDLWLRFVERGWRGLRVRQPYFVWRRHSDSTMIMQVIHNHEALYRGIMERHADLFRRHADEVLLRANVLLRRCDMNWLDESGDPINLVALKRQREMYESMLAVRMHRALHRLVGRLPRPLGSALRGSMALAKRLAPARAAATSASAANLLASPSPPAAPIPPPAAPKPAAVR